LPKEDKMGTRVKRLRLFLGLSIVLANVQPVLAMGGAGPPSSAMTRQYCTEQVVNKGITNVEKFNAEVKKCMDNPVTYPTTYR
jgi:hypothetical protein